MNYQDMVIEARGLLQRDKQTRDRLISLTVDAVQHVSQSQWAEDIGAHRSTVRDWLRYARETNDLGAAAPTYDDWYRANRRDESDRGVSAVQAMPTERKAAVAREMLADPEVAKAALSDPDTARDVASAAPGQVGKALAEHHERVREHVERGPSAQLRENMQTRIEVQQVILDLIKVRQSIGRLSGLGRIQPIEMEMLADEAAQTLPAVQWVADLSPDKADIGESAEAFLRGLS